MSGSLGQYDDENDVRIQGATDSTEIGNVGDRLKVDADISNVVLSGVDWGHARIHAGRAFFYTTHDSMGPGDVIEIAMTTPDTTTRPHVTAIVASENGVLVDLYEGSTLVKGAVLTAYNRDRDSATANTTILNAVTSVGADGTQLLEDVVGAGANKGGRGNGGQEIVFKRNTIYLLRLTSSVAGNETTLRIDFYESENP